ncbi:tyrosine-type recombinase/integrase [Elizabethkingia miricola]|uniref:Tyrosine-type recombinase/integrase n=1 Tax=Elizabethkingia miricola TaxID=172045 RepID=A0ABD5B452_ELIMR|nr:tyrosine-type recombinase/integrase [Elizabethkingia miricola]MDQ8747868.1 tyrosine-type recombinase/integrase [Elizabethkingia miricola]MPS75019.1 site-specific integrase [Chryseobacterium sp.]
MNKKRITEVITHWKADKKQYVKKSSFSAYTLLIENHLQPVFGDKFTIEETDVQSFVFQKLEAGLSHKTIKDILIVLKMILKFGAKHKWLDYTPFDIQFPTEREKHNIEVLSRADQKKIMTYIQEHFTFRNLGVYICLSAGMRIGEVCALTWEDIDTDNGIISVSRTIQRIYVIEEGLRKTELILDTPKTKNSIREIPINKDLLKILKPFKKIVNSSFFVLTNDAKPTEPRTYRSYYKNLMKELNMPELKFHGLRHSFATRCIESNCDYKTVSVLLGHSNISTTLNLYVHPNMEQKKKAIEQMFKALR